MATVNNNKPNKRFSFAGFSSSLSRSLSFSAKTATAININEDAPIAKKEDEEKEKERKTKRAQKSKSLYIKSFKKVGTSEPLIQTYDASEAVQTNGKEVRNSIRRSLSAVLYASPHGNETGDNKLVPILVTPALSESVGGILLNDTKEQEEEKKSVKKKKIEYDNRLEVFKTKQGDAVTLLWQGYGYNVKDATTSVEALESRFEKDVWSDYRGLIHPLHLVMAGKGEEEEEKEDNDACLWGSLSVRELRQYYDNYGSMMLKIRETRMLKQQQQYVTNSMAP